MPREVTRLLALRILPLIEQSIGREGQILAKTFPPRHWRSRTRRDGFYLGSFTARATGRPATAMQASFDQFRITFEGVRQPDDGDMGASECGYFPGGVAYGPQHQDERECGLILQFEGPSGIPYLTHDELDAARQRLIAEGGTSPRAFAD